MADGLPKELTSGEKVFINSFLREPPQWIRWVKKTNPKNAIQPRLMVVTKYKVYSIKRNKMGKKQIVREGHLYNLREVSTDDIDRCVLIFKEFKIVAHAPNLGIDLPRVVLQCFYNISFTFSEAAFPKVTMSPAERSPPAIDRNPPGPAAGFEEVYLAQCDFLGAAPSQDIIIMVDDLFASGTTSLDLDLCTGIEKDHQYALNLSPIFAALRHNTYFTAISLHEKSRANETIRGLADVLTHNVTLTSVDVSGSECSSDEAWEAFGEALKANTHNALLHLNLSDNPFGDKGSIPLCAGLASISHPMNTLNISGTNMQAKGITQFFRTLVSNMVLSSGLYEVNVSNNPIPGGPLSVAVSDWLVALNEHYPDNKPIRKLNLAACAVDIPHISDHIRNNFTNTIEHLDLSNNKIEEYPVQLLITLINKSTALHHLNLSNCNLTAALLTAVVNATAVNPSLVNFELDLSGNDLSKEDQSVISFAGAIARCINIHTLKIAEMNLKKETLIPVCKSIGENNTLIALDFAGNFKHGTLGGKGENPIDLLVHSIKAHPTLTSLSVAGRKEFQLFKEMIPLFRLLVDNNKLLELDVSHNKFGDDGARELFDTLRTNYCLKTLSFDHNNITYPGWQALRRCILVNRSLVDIKYPKKDITKTINFSKDKVEMLNKLRDLFIEVAIFTNNNLMGVADARPLQPSPKAPILVPPFELFLSTGSQTYTPTPQGQYTNTTGYSTMPLTQTASLYNITPIDPHTPTPQTGSYSPNPSHLSYSPQAGGNYSPVPAAHAPLSRAASVYGAAPMPPSQAYSPSMRPASMYPLAHSNSLPAMHAPPPPPSSSAYSPPAPPPNYESTADDFNYAGNEQGQHDGNSYDSPPVFPARTSGSASRPASVMGPSRNNAPPPMTNPHATVSYGTSPLRPPPPLKSPPSLAPPPPLNPPPPLSSPPPLKSPPSSLPPNPGNTLKTSQSGSSLPPNTPPPPPPATAHRGTLSAPPPPPPAEPYPYAYDDQAYDPNYTQEQGQEEAQDQQQYDNYQYDNQGASEEVEDLTPTNSGGRNSQSYYY